MVGSGPFELVEYEPALEAWYVFIHNEGFAGWDTPFRTKVATYPAADLEKTFLVRDRHLFVGLIDVAKPRGEDPRAAEVDKIGVLPQYRGRGLGGLLVGAAARWERLQGYASLHAIVALLDLRLHEFYVRHGFAVEQLLVEVEGPEGEVMRLDPAELAERLAAAHGGSPGPSTLRPGSGQASQRSGLTIRSLLYHYRRSLGERSAGS